jgi:polyisoprenyl-teichoic acid--peptidoglycan teichoic acid transferase
VAGVLSVLLPGAGHLYAGARRRGLVLLCLSAALLGTAVALVAVRPVGLEAVLDTRALGVLLALNAVVFAFRLFAVVDSWRAVPGPAPAAAVTLLAAFGMLAAVPHLAVGYVTVRGYVVLDSVFADEEPADAPGSGTPLLPARPVRASSPGGGTVPAGEPLEETRRPLAGSIAATQDPWVTLLLLGSDAGPDQWGERTDTMIAVALQRETGRAVAFGIPRNLVEVPLAGIAAEVEAGLEEPFDESINALYAYAQEHPELFPGGDDPGATALKATLSALLGLRLDYYALVDLAGFADLVDALGGVEIDVKERLVDEVTRPRWGVPKPRIDVHPGRTYRLDGMQALAYVRSRKSSSDYGRMARQRCFLSALTRQLDAVTVLRNFGTLASTIERSVATDLPLSRLPELVRLAAAVDPEQTLMQSFGVEYIERRRASDGYPIPDAEAIRATVRDTVLFPRDAEATGLAVSAGRAC